MRRGGETEGAGGWKDGSALSESLNRPDATHTTQLLAVRVTAERTSVVQVVPCNPHKRTHGQGGRGAGWGGWRERLLSVPRNLQQPTQTAWAWECGAGWRAQGSGVAPQRQIARHAFRILFRTPLAGNPAGAVSAGARLRGTDSGG